MDAATFRKAGKEMVDLVADYLESVEERAVVPDIQPGDVFHSIPVSPPENGEHYSAIFSDIERIVMPGVTHWQHPNFYAYYPAGNSYSAILADMLSDAIGCVGFSWIASPACTEMEMKMMNWLARLLQLPEEFLFSENAKTPSKGGGVIQGTASEATLVSLLAARSVALEQNKRRSEELIMYCSDQAHSSVERAGLMAGVTVRAVETDAECRMTAAALKSAMEMDLEKGLQPFFVVATLGTTSTCAFDKLPEIGRMCRDHFPATWLHVDAAYAGSAAICPELRHHFDGVEFASSFNFNPHKWLPVNFDCSALWFRDSRRVESAFGVNPVYLRHAHQNSGIPDYRHWQIPLGRRFRSLKLWFVIRTFGAEGLRQRIRKDISLARHFEHLVSASSCFQVTNQVNMGLVCFRCKNDESNEKTRQLLQDIQADGRLHLISSEVKNELILRLAICSPKTNEKYLEEAWKIIMELNDNSNCNSNSNSNSNSRPSKEKRTTETEDTIKREYY